MTEASEITEQVRIEDATVTITDGKREYVLETPFATLEAVYLADDRGLFNPYRKLVVAMHCNTEQFTLRELPLPEQDGPRATHVWIDEINVKPRYGWAPDLEGFPEADAPTKEDIIIGLLNQIINKLDPKVLTAPGGLCAPPRMRDYLPTLSADRGGITYLGGDLFDVPSDWTKPKKKKKGKKKK